MFSLNIYFVSSYFAAERRVKHAITLVTTHEPEELRELLPQVPGLGTS